MKKTIITTIFFALTIFCANGQIIEPLDLAKKIFNKENTIDIKNYSTGEYEGSPSGKDLRNDVTTKFLLLEQKESKAVVAMTILDSTGNGLDTYLYFEKDKIWKMSSFRSLAMTGIIEAMKNELETMTPKQVAKRIKNAKGNKKSKKPTFASIEEYNFLFGNAKLTLDLDENIFKHFLKNEAEFERLKNFALLELGKSKVDDERSINLIKKMEVNYNKIYIRNISYGGHELDNCINFLIGGMLDNAVGYIYVKDKKDLPEMSEGGIIMIREIGNGWYIYKTT